MPTPSSRPARPPSFAAAPPPPPSLPPLPPDQRFRPFSGRQRLRIVLLTLLTVVVLWWLLLVRPGGHPRVLPPEPCRPGQFKGCIGGGLAVKLLPPAAQTVTTSQPGASAPGR